MLLLAKLLATDQPDNDQLHQDTAPPAPPLPRQKPNMYKVAPPSDSKYDNKMMDPFIHICVSSLVLSRVQAFLPQLQTANSELDKKDPSELDIENVNEEQEGQYIEMVSKRKREMGSLKRVDIDTHALSVAEPGIGCI